MYAAILELNKTVYSPIRGTDDGAACEKAAGMYGGFWCAAREHTHSAVAALVVLSFAS
jgi:hypothetical protein